MNRVRVPRASMAVTLLDDAEFIGLLQSGHSGRDAALLFVCLVIAAKKQRNGGVFHQGTAVIAAMAQWPVVPFTKALDHLTQHTNWVVRNQERLVIRSFNKWQSEGWGGPREGSGRPPDDNQVANQDGIKMDSSCCHSVPVSVPMHPNENQTLVPPSSPKVERDRSSALRGGDAKDGPSNTSAERARSFLKARALLADVPISGRNRRAAENWLDALPNSLAVITRVLEEAKKQKLLGDRQAGYVYKALKHEAGAVAKGAA